MSSAISGLLSTASVNAVNTAPTNPANSALAQTSQANAASGDTVTLSPSQQAHQLYHQGQAVSQIAVTLGLSIETVNSYLNISNPKS
jgi:DNA-binding CsgD family transcriptional regulator